jgi:hypothetical protein
VRKLIDSCIRKDQDSWDLLWRMVLEGSRPTVERILWSHGLPRSLRDDVFQNMYIYMQSNNFRRLEIFRGESDAEFRAFSRSIARRFATKLAGRWRREHAEEREALRVKPESDRCGLSEMQVRSAYEEIVGRMTAKDRKRLVHVLAASRAPGDGRPSGAEPRPNVPSRTIRHWSERIIRVYFRD